MWQSLPQPDRTPRLVRRPSPAFPRPPPERAHRSAMLEPRRRRPPLRPQRGLLPAASNWKHLNRRAGDWAALPWARPQASLAPQSRWSSRRRSGRPRSRAPAPRRDCTVQLPPSHKSGRRPTRPIGGEPATYRLTARVKERKRGGTAPNGARARRKHRGLYGPRQEAARAVGGARDMRAPARRPFSPRRQTDGLLIPAQQRGLGGYRLSARGFRPGEERACFLADSRWPIAESRCRQEFH